GYLSAHDSVGNENKRDAHRAPHHRKQSLGTILVQAVGKGVVHSSNAFRRYLLTIKAGYYSGIYNQYLAP
ncbi:MAG: hypothetical protein L0G68_04190, partial [Psychrobacter sp.]|nr:hypothetical protein [Psychrobacter sp.]